MKIEKGYLVFTAPGSILVLTSCNSIKHARVLEALKAKGMNKFVALEVPVSSLKASYSAHFEHLMTDPKANDVLAVLDDDGPRIFRNIDFRELGEAIVYGGD